MPLHLYGGEHITAAVAKLVLTDEVLVALAKAIPQYLANRGAATNDNKAQPTLVS